MKYVTLADHAMREYAPDKILRASQKAKAAIAESRRCRDQFHPRSVRMMTES